MLRCQHAAGNSVVSVADSHERLVIGSPTVLQVPPVALEETFSLYQDFKLYKQSVPAVTKL